MATVFLPLITSPLIFLTLIFTLFIFALTFALYHRQQSQRMHKIAQRKKKILSIVSDLKYQKQVNDAYSRSHLVQKHIANYAKTPSTESTVHTAIELMLAFKHAETALKRSLPSQALSCYTNTILTVDQAFLKQNPLLLCQEYIQQHASHAHSLHYAHTLAYYFATHSTSHYIKATRILAESTTTPKQRQDAYASTTRAMTLISNERQPGHVRPAANHHLFKNQHTHLPLTKPSEKQATYMLHFDLCCQLGLKEEAEQTAQAIHQLMPENQKTLQVLMMREYENEEWEAYTNYMHQFISTTLTEHKNTGKQKITIQKASSHSTSQASVTPLLQPSASSDLAGTSKDSLPAPHSSDCKAPTRSQIISFLTASTASCTLLDNATFQSFYGKQTKNTPIAKIENYIHALYHSMEFDECLVVAMACLSVGKHPYAAIYAGSSQLELEKYAEAEKLLSIAIQDKDVKANTYLYCFVLEGLMQIALHRGQQHIVDIHMKNIKKSNPSHVIRVERTPSLKLYPVHLKDTKYVSLSAEHGMTHFPLDLAEQTIDPIIDMVLEYFKSIQSAMRWTSITFPTSSEYKENMVRTLRSTTKPSENYLTRYQRMIINTKFENDTSLSVDFVKNLSLAKKLNALFKRHSLTHQGFLDGLVEAYPKHFPIPGIMMDGKGCFYAFLWHGSGAYGKQSKLNILQTGLLLEYARPGIFGTGIYASPTFSKAQQYSVHTFYFLLYNLGTNPEITDSSCANHYVVAQKPFTSKLAKSSTYSNWEIILYEDQKHLALCMLECDQSKNFTTEDIRTTCKKQCQQLNQGGLSLFSTAPAASKKKVQCHIQ